MGCIVLSKNEWMSLKKTCLKKEDVDHDDLSQMPLRLNMLIPQLDKVVTWIVPLFIFKIHIFLELEYSRSTILNVTWRITAQDCSLNFYTFKSLHIPQTVSWHCAVWEKHLVLSFFSINIVFKHLSDFLKHLFKKKKKWASGSLLLLKDRLSQI